jgi:hypothetical protein
MTDSPIRLQKTAPSELKTPRLVRSGFRGAARPEHSKAAVTRKLIVRRTAPSQNGDAKLAVRAWSAP